MVGKSYMELNTQKNKIMYFTSKTDSTQSNYYVSDTTKCLSVMLRSKLYPHLNVDSIHSKALRPSGLIHYITYNFLSLSGLIVLYIALIRSKLENATVVWNNLTVTYSNNLEII